MSFVPRIAFSLLKILFTMFATGLASVRTAQEAAARSTLLEATIFGI